MKSFKFGFSAILGLCVLAISCNKEGCADSEAYNYNPELRKDKSTCIYPKTATISFTQSWANSQVTEADFNNLKYKNENNESMSITKLRYSISDIRFYKEDGDSVVIDVNHLIDLEDAASLQHEIEQKIDPIIYSGIGFIFGLVPEKNITDSIESFNGLDWAWDPDFGGGYHQMQLQGVFTDQGGSQENYEFNTGSAIKTTGSSEAATPNHFFVKLNKDIDMECDRIIEIDMQIGEWFRNPYTWDVSANHINLEGNFTAQGLLTNNGKSVFRLGEIK